MHLTANKVSEQVNRKCPPPWEVSFTTLNTTHRPRTPPKNYVCCIIIAEAVHWNRQTGIKRRLWFEIVDR